MGTSCRIVIGRQVSEQSTFLITDKATGFCPGARGRTSNPLTESRTRPGNCASVFFWRTGKRRFAAGFLGLSRVGMPAVKTLSTEADKPTDCQLRIIDHHFLGGVIWTQNGGRGGVDSLRSGSYPGATAPSLSLPQGLRLQFRLRRNAIRYANGGKGGIG